MNLVDFGLSVLSGVFANKFDQVMAGFKPKPVEDETTQNGIRDQNRLIVADQVFAATVINDRVKLFRSFDAFNDLTALLTAVREPLVSVLIEEQPSTYYRLPALIIESRLTAEWFVMERGRMSFQGGHGGMNNAKRILGEIKSRDIPVSVWVIQNKLLDDLEDGYVLWPDVRAKAVPLLARISEDYTWDEIDRNIGKILSETKAKDD